MNVIIILNQTHTKKVIIKSILLLLLLMRRNELQKQIRYLFVQNTSFISPLHSLTADTDQLAAITADLTPTLDAPTLTSVLCRHITSLCTTPITRASLALQDTLHTYLRIHPEAELGLQHGLVGTVIRSSTAVARTSIAEVTNCHVTGACLSYGQGDVFGELRTGGSSRHTAVLVVPLYAFGDEHDCIGMHG